MATKMSLGLKQTQSLAMTPQLQQAIKMLTLTHLEMTSVIAEQMQENPMLEEGNTEISKEEAKEIANKQETSAENFEGPQIVEGGKDNFDWDKYIESYNSNSSAPTTRERLTKDDAPNYENMVSKGENLYDHLMWQLRMEEISPELIDVALQIIHNINEDGYLESSIEEIAKSTKYSLDDLQYMLEKIQHLDPLGCGAIDLKECLLIQARALDDHVPLVEKIIKNHLELLKQRDYKKLSETLNVSLDSVKNAELVIHGLHPKPGRLVSPEETHYVVPDIFVKKVGDEYVIQLNDEGVPNLKVSKMYQDMMKNYDKKSEENEYVQDKLRQALWLIKSIENRQKTIHKVANAILKYQPEFFKKGSAYLKPMILKDIAAEIGMHESTVSRVTTNKYMHTPLGTFELKFFFNTGIGAKNGGIDIAGEGLKAKIKELIDREDKKKPLSDQRIADILSKSGIAVARRTVAKYREGLGILSSSKRKNLK